MVTAIHLAYFHTDALNLGDLGYLIWIRDSGKAKARGSSCFISILLQCGLVGIKNLTTAPPCRHSVAE